MKKSKRLILLIPVIVVVGLLMYLYLKSRSEHDPNVIRVSGNIEVTDVALAFKIPGLVKERHVSEGELVREGDIVAVLDASDLQREVAMRKAELKAAQTQLGELEAGSRPEEIAAAQAAVTKAEAFLSQLEAGSRPEEIASAEANVTKAKADLAVAEGEHRRSEEPHKKEAISTQEAEKAVDATKALVQDARESLRAAEERYSQGAGTFLDLLDAQVTLAQAEAKLVQTTFDHYTAYATFRRATGRLL